MSFSVVFIRSEPGFGGDTPMPLGTKTQVPVGVTVFLGRSTDAQIHMPEGTVARLHALLAVMPDKLRLLVVDLGSTNGIHVGGAPRQVALLASGEEFRIANRYWFRVVQD
ncbi:FHA domain-containing protein [Cystobacter fuscus]|uniref:FHA domain-containing protein n=1 Tax=Cystobacter fuscus TaxID=43 RepID=UPI002B289191|nr:FHA domain-containing protein [Cystobacter fuscus]